MKRVLFADDSRAFLDELAIAFQAEKKCWDMAFVTSGADALDTIAYGSPFDVVVSSFSLRDMGGLEFFSTVMERYPETARIGLSDADDSETVLKAGTVTHQFLEKPVDPHELRVLIGRALAIRDRLMDPALRKSLPPGGACSSIT